MPAIAESSPGLKTVVGARTKLFAIDVENYEIFIRILCPFAFWVRTLGSVRPFSLFVVEHWIRLNLLICGRFPLLFGGLMT